MQPWIVIKPVMLTGTISRSELNFSYCFTLVFVTALLVFSKTFHQFCHKSNYESRNHIPGKSKKWKFAKTQNSFKGNSNTFNLKTGHVLQTAKLHIPRHITLKN